MLENSIDIKKDFHNHFNSLLKREKSMMVLFYEIFVIGTAYIVGGYFRDYINDKPSRDIDVIVDIETNKLLEILNQINCVFEINRHGGVKIIFDSISLDVWSIENNWAFKNKLVKLNEDDKLNSIAKGCFYNYDSLVINLHNFSYNLRYYKDFASSKKLDILQSKSLYKNLNPTTEANILRAFFIKHKLGVTFTENTYYYLIRKIGSLDDSYNNNSISRLLEIKMQYPKYNELTDELLIQYINNLKTQDLPNNQLIIDI